MTAYFQELLYFTAMPSTLTTQSEATSSHVNKRKSVSKSAIPGVSMTVMRRLLKTVLSAWLWVVTDLALHLA